MEKTATEAWARTLQELRRKIGAQRFELWFKHTELISMSPELVEIGAPNVFVAEWLQTHYAGLVSEGLQEGLGSAPRVKFRTSPRLFRRAWREHSSQTAGIVSEATAGKKREAAPPAGGEMSLEGFVVGPGNRLAHACAMEVVSTAHSRYNPLFLYSGCGLGKTHLLNGVWNGLRRRERHPAELVSAEAFGNEFIYAMNTRRLDAFRQRYRTAGVLLVDDVHFFNGKKGLQEELLHTLDAVQRSGEQVVLASDTHPRKMRSFQRGLISRFVSGMVVCIEPPDLDTRSRILRAKAAALGHRISEEVLGHIAGQVTGSVRDLEGAFNAVVAYARLCDREPDLEIARQALGSLHLEGVRAPLTVERIEEVVSEVFAVSVSALRSGRRSHRISAARQAAMSLVRALTHLSCSEIAAHFGNKHHSSVYFAEKRVSDRRSADPSFAAKFGEVERRLRR